MKRGTRVLNVETAEVRDRARQLRRLSRDHPELSAKLGEAHTLLERAGKLTAEGAAEATATLADLTLTTASVHTLRVRSVHEPAALQELARRGELALAA